MIARLILALTLLLNARAAFAEFKVPAMTGPVNDYAGMLTPAAKARLDSFLRALWAGGGSQIAVLTVPNLGGAAVEEASIKTVEAWKLGTAKGDNGVLLLLSTDEHALRIEVGQSLEGSLPDAYAKRIIDNLIIPEMRAGDFSRGITQGVNGIVAKTDPKAGQIGEPAGEPAERSPRGRGFGGLPFPFRILITLAVIIWIFSGGGGGGYRRRGIFWLGGGGGGGGGGGWSGGGGGFSGGGASGKW